MTDTANLRLPCIQGSQAQKHVTHNEALRILDSVVQLAVHDRDLAAPPSAPWEGDRYIVSAGATGAWAGRDEEIAAWQDGAWMYSIPRIGWLAYVIDEGALLAWDGIEWIDAIAALTSLNNMVLLGVGTAADATNPFSLKLNNTLFAARTVAEGGDGHLRYKLSKESAAKTLSLLFQNNFSGRAEIGLAGDDDFHVKVSADGTIWHEGIVIDRTTGAVTFPNTTIAGGRDVLTANRTYYVRTDGSDSNNGLADASAGAFLTIQKAVDTAAALDLSVYDVIIQVGNGTYTGAVSVACPFLGGSVTLKGDTTTPSNVVISTTSANAVTVTNKAAISIQGFKLQTTTGGNALSADNGANVKVTGKMDYGACAGFHLHVSGTGARIVVSAGYTISGGAQLHWIATEGGNLSVIPSGLTVTLTGMPSFSSAFAYASRLGGMTVWGHTFSGAASGTRYIIDGNSVVFVNGAGASYLPGSGAGSTASGGQYY